MKQENIKNTMKKLSVIFLFSLLFTNCVNSNIEIALKKQIELYPSQRLQDIYKNFYQGRFGTEHLIRNKESVLKYIKQELIEMDTSYLPVVEYIGWDSSFVRVSLEYLKQNNIESDILANTFFESANYIDTNKTNIWLKEWFQIIKIIENENIKIINYEADKKSIDSLLKINSKAAIHHSKEFREAYKPHYRVVAVPLFEKYFKSK